MSRFVDTSYFLPLLIPGDQYHAAAVSLASQWRGYKVTTDFVMVEVANHLSPRQSRGVFAKFFRTISGDPRMNILPASRHLIERGTSLYETRGDKDWFFTDFIFFEAMRDVGLADALTADHHFEQAGFNILMR